MTERGQLIHDLSRLGWDFREHVAPGGGWRDNEFTHDGVAAAHRVSYEPLTEGQILAWLAEVMMTPRRLRDGWRGIAVPDWDQPKVKFQEWWGMTEEGKRYYRYEVEFPDD